MIYSDDAPSNSSKQNQAIQQPRREEPPSYSGPQAYPQPYPQVRSYPQSYSYVVGVVTPEPAGLRFIKAFLVAVFIWLLLSLLVRTSVTALHGGHWRGAWGDYSYDVPQGVTLQQCVQGSEWSLASLATPSSTPTDIAQTNIEIHEQSLQSKTSFDLPLSSETLFFLTRGQLLGGILHVETSPNQAQDSAKVNIVIRYDHPELRDLTKACVLSRRQGENGIGVFAPIWRRYPGSRYSIRFEMTIILPEPTRSSAPFVIKNFETDIFNSAHMLDDLNGLVFFDSISLRGSNGIIKADSLNATKGKIHTSNGGISGKFRSTHELVLETSNGPIKVAVELESDESSPSLKARTSNGLVEADVSLLSASASGGSFDVSVRTSNAPLRVSFPDSPVDSHLKFEATTSNSPAFVSLNPAYEGSFHLRTSSSDGPAIRRRSDVEDPTGKGRSRQVVYKLIGKKESIGDIYWGDEKTPNGVVDVRTSNAHLSLEV